MPILDPSMDVDACLHFQVSMAPAIKSMAEAFGCSRAELKGPVLVGVGAVVGQMLL